MPHAISRADEGIVRAGSPAVVVSVHVEPGDAVAAGERLAMLEAMKMEMAVTAPFAGTVRQVFVLPNGQVGPGTPLVHLEPAAEGRSQEDGPQGGLRRRQDARRARRRAAGLQGPGVAERRQGRPAGVQARRAGARSQRAACHAGGHSRLRSRRRGGGACAAGVRPAQPVPAAGRNATAPGRGRPADGVRRRARGVRPPVGRRGGGQPVAELGAVPVQVPADARFARRRSAVGVRRPAPVGPATLQRGVARADACAARGPPGAVQGPPAQRPPGPGRPGGAGASSGRRTGPGSGQSGVSSDRRAPDRRRARAVPRPGRPRARCPLSLCRAAGVRTDTRRRAGADVRGPAATRPPAPDGPEADARREELVACPQPLRTVFVANIDEMSQAVQADDPRGDDAARLPVPPTRGHPARRRRENGRWCWPPTRTRGRQIDVIATGGRFEDARPVLSALRNQAAALPIDHECVAEVYFWRSDLANLESSAAMLGDQLEQAGFDRPLRRVVFVLVPGDGAGADLQFLTFRPFGPGYREEKVFRGLHPMQGKQLEFWRLRHFFLERLPGRRMCTCSRAWPARTRATSGSSRSSRCERRTPFATGPAGSSACPTSSGWRSRRSRRCGGPS